MWMLTNAARPFKKLGRGLRKVCRDCGLGRVSRGIREKEFMQNGTIAKYAEIALALAGLLVLPGCWIQSIHGLYEEGMSKQDPDVVVDQRLT